MLRTLLFVLVPFGPEQSTVVYTRPGATDVYLWGQGLPDGRQYEYSMPQKSRDGPAVECREGSATPSISRGLAIAQRALRSDHPEWRENEINLWTIQLQQASAADLPGRWLYVFTFYRLTKGELPQSDATVLVLMDGSVVKPRAGQPLNARPLGRAGLPASTFAKRS